MDRDTMMAHLLLLGFAPFEMGSSGTVLWSAERGTLMRACRIASRLYCTSEVWSRGALRFANDAQWSDISDEFLELAFERTLEKDDEHTPLP